SPLENGMIMYLELSKSIDAKKAKSGDAVSAVLLADVVSRGKIVLRSDSKLLGHVTEARAFSKETPESRLGIVFDKIMQKGGREMAFRSVLLAVRPAPPLQISTLSAPAPPGTTTPQPERHYPMPKTQGMPVPASNRDPEIRKTRESLSGGGMNVSQTELDGLSLEPSADGANRVLVSFKRTVKLENGMRLELRVTDGGTAK
ncbi:MAG TPA: hypothetical protein VE133_16170, partial [Candidatus Sulfotelmatobacter sp.]|nr:hypothetical protein [Candidatus Sulfotelmatobacter sp.]